VKIGSKSKTCKLDPIPTQLLKNCLEALLPTITKLVNLTFDTSTMPLNQKKVFATPLLKSRFWTLRFLGITGQDQTLHLF
jgi:hypothetical protein